MCRQAPWPYLQQLEGSALLQLLEHGFQVPEGAAGPLHVSLKPASSEQAPRGICKILAEREQLLLRQAAQISCSSQVECRICLLKQAGRQCRCEGGLLGQGVSEMPSSVCHMSYGKG